MSVRPDAPMLFGKHKGKPLRELPKDYLRWLNGNVKLTGWLRDTVRWLLGQPVRLTRTKETDALIAAMQEEAWQDWEKRRQKKAAGDSESGSLS